MAPDLVETKFHAPRTRAGLVHRRRLAERLARGSSSKLTLVSAPPGFGKSTLVADWLAERGPSHRTAWLSLEPSDNDPQLFWRYVVAALGRAGSNTSPEAAAVLESSDPRVELALHSLINDLAALDHDLVLVLDDFHVIDRREVHEGLEYLVDRLPPTVHLVITTRVDPPLPLARLRVRGELVEIRAGDLRFTQDEAAEYLNGTMGLRLTAADVAALEGRTEGWIAALQLAALSMQGRADTTSFVASFAGDDRFVVDYLADEVLSRQTEDTRAFLLRTSILDRMSGPLCDAVTGRSDGRAVLDRLDRGNLFLIALDDQRRWYRYHHLFADVLRAHLSEEDPDSLALLHRRASEWFERNGDHEDAIRHALDGADHAGAAELIERAWRTSGRARTEMAMRRWLEALPPAIFENRPVLAAAFAGVLMQTGEVDRVEVLLGAAERALGADRTRTAHIADADEGRRLPGTIAMLRAGHARITGDLPGTIENAQRTIQLAAPDDHLSRGGASALLGLASWELGDLDAAYRWYSEGMASLDLGGHRSDVVGGQVTLADIRIAQGRLGEAIRAYQRGLDLAVRDGGPPLRGAADMHVGMSDILRERNDLVRARQHLAISRELGHDNGLPKNPYRSLVVEARISQVEGDSDVALALLDEAERVFFADFSPVVAPIAALKARILIAGGRLAAAREWADRARLRATDEVTYVGQFDLATLSRLLLAEGRADESIALADRLVTSASDGGWVGPALDALIVQALAHHARGDTAGALASMRAAIEHAEPEGYVRIFADEGAPMAALLREAARRGLASSYVSLIEAAVIATGRTRRQPLSEPLSERELEVLRLLATDLSGPEIADHLVVSLNTVRSHTKAIFAKLDVNSRRAAVSRASELDLIAPNRG